jgi:hypothetical protein
MYIAYLNKNQKANSQCSQLHSGVVTPLGDKTIKRDCLGLQ